MNLAITTTSASTWKAVKRHYFIALGGACLALATIVGSGVLSDNEQAAPAAASPNSSADVAYSSPYAGGYNSAEELLEPTGMEIVDVRQPELRESLAPPPRPIVIYLVESQARANDILAAVRNEMAESDTSQTMYFAFKATTPEEEASVTAIVETWQGKDVTGIAETWGHRDVQLVDLRNFAPID